MTRLVSIMAMSAISLAACGPATPPPAPPPDLNEPTDSQAAPAAPVETETSVSTATVQTTGYPEGWEMQLFWSGEYPNAFAVIQEGVTVMGHELITYNEHPPIYCGLPAKATYSSWNTARAETDDLTFVTMTFPTEITLKEDATVLAFTEAGEVELALKAGDQLTYKAYLSEGYFIAEKDGVEYEINEGELPQGTEFGEGPEEHEWVQVTCTDADRTRAWIRYDDAIAAQGVEPYNYTGYGEAADLP